MCMFVFVKQKTADEMRISDWSSDVCSSDHDKVGELRPKSGLRFTIGRIDGSIYTHATLIDVRVYDPQGLVFAAPRAQLDWRPFAWFSNKLIINRMIVPMATLAKLPKTRPSGENKPILPGFDVHIGDLRIDRLAVAPAVTGIARSGRVEAGGDIASGRARVARGAVVRGCDRVRMTLASAPHPVRMQSRVQGNGPQ